MIKFVIKVVCKSLISIPITVFFLIALDFVVTKYLGLEELSTFTELVLAASLLILSVALGSIIVESWLKDDKL